MGTWSPAPTSFAVRWQRCSSFECITIPGATGTTYIVGAADLGERLRVAVTATNAGGDSEAVSAQTQPVQQALPVPPTNLSAPSFLGFPQEGETLVAQPGSWTGAPTSYSYQWFTCAPIGISCPDIPNANGQTYLVSGADVDRFIGVEVIATNAGGSSAPEASDAFGPVPPAAPKNQVPPSVSGTPQVGQTLTAVTGTWTGAPTSYRIQWYRCDAPVTDCSEIPSATSTTYVAAAADAGGRLGVGVIASNRGGDSFEEGSYVTDVVAAAPVVAPPPAPPPPPPAAPVVVPLPNDTFTMRARARSDGSLAITLQARGRGTFSGVATASNAQLARGCRRCTRTGRGIYGRGASRSSATGAAQLVIRPRANARRALRRSGSIAVRVRVIFRAASGADLTQTRTVSVKGRRASATSRAARSRGARVQLAAG